MRRTPLTHPPLYRCHLLRAVMLILKIKFNSDLSSYILSLHEENCRQFNIIVVRKIGQ
jgi:hypothetical protein